VARLVRNPDVLVYWDAGGVEAVNLGSGVRVCATPDLLSLLAAFTKPRDASRIPPRLRGAVRILRKAGFLVEPAGVRASAGRLAAFRGLAASAHYVAATRDKKFIETPAEVERYIRKEILPERRPARFKRYSGGVRRPLSDALPGGDGAALGRLLVARRTTREFAKTPVSFDDLSIVVRATWARIGWLETELLGRLALKTSPSAGALHPMECYVLAWNVRGLGRGIWHYDVPTDAFRLLRRGDFRKEAVRVASGQRWVGNAAFLCVLTAVIGRTLWKYRSENALRSVFMEAGHIGQTFALVATGRGLGPFQTAAIQDSYTERLLGLRGAGEFPVYLLGAGVPIRGGFENPPRG
jgi:SagB-type dehydrogenase family enzyme